MNSNYFVKHTKLGGMMKLFISIVVGLIVFAIWMNIVGNPHVVETVIGVVLATVSAFYTHRTITNIIKRFKQGDG